MSFSSPIYGDYNGIFLIFIQVTLQNLWAPVCNRPEIFHFYNYRKVRFSVRCNYSVPRSINHAVVLTHAANATMDGQGICDPG